MLDMCFSCDVIEGWPDTAAPGSWDPHFVPVLLISLLECRLKKAVGILVPKRRIHGLLKPCTCIAYGKIVAEAVRA